MAKSKETAAPQSDNTAPVQPPFLAAPAGEHLASHFWQAQEGILKETEDLMTKWFKRRHDATRSALETCTGAAAATGAREEDAFGGERSEELPTGRNHDRFVRVAIDLDGDVARADQPGACEQNHHNQKQHGHGEHHNANHDRRVEHRF